MDDMKGIPNGTYSVSYGIPNDANANVSNCVKELLAEEKNVACLKKENVIIAVIGYKEGWKLGFVFILFIKILITVFKW